MPEHKKRSTKVRSEHIIGVFIFWISLFLVLSGFIINSYWSCLLFIFIIPVMFGNHEAIHGNILPNAEKSKIKSFHNELVFLMGSSIQIINLKLLRISHITHHALGRHDDGYSPDIVPGKHSVRDYLAYYGYLTFIPALENQAVGFILVFIPAKYLPFEYELNFKKTRSKVQFALVQLVCLLFLFFMLYCGGLYKFLIYEILFSFTWSILQNSAHYGLKGIDSKTDRVCAHTYFLETPFKLLTYGTTSHLAHHVEMNIPCLDLYDEKIVKEIEKKIGVEIVVKRGIASFVKDIFVQFKGPLNVENLHTEWIKRDNHLSGSSSTIAIASGKRKGILRKLKNEISE